MNQLEGHREPDHRRAQPLQRGGAGLQHPDQALPDGPVRRHVRLPAAALLRSRARRRDRAAGGLLGAGGDTPVAARRIERVRSLKEHRGKGDLPMQTRPSFSPCSPSSCSAPRAARGRRIKDRTPGRGLVGPAPDHRRGHPGRADQPPGHGRSDDQINVTWQDNSAGRDPVPARDPDRCPAPYPGRGHRDPGQRRGRAGPRPGRPRPRPTSSGSRRATQRRLALLQRGLGHDAGRDRACVASATAMCLNGGRFRVEAAFRTNTVSSARPGR